MNNLENKNYILYQTIWWDCYPESCYSKRIIYNNEVIWLNDKNHCQEKIEIKEMEEINYLIKNIKNINALQNTSHCNSCMDIPDLILTINYKEEWFDIEREFDLDWKFLWDPEDLKKIEGLKNKITTITSMCKL